MPCPVVKKEPGADPSAKEKEDTALHLMLFSPSSFLFPVRRLGDLTGGRGQVHLSLCSGAPLQPTAPTRQAAQSLGQHVHIGLSGSYHRQQQGLVTAIRLPTPWHRPSAQGRGYPIPAEEG